MLFISKFIKVDIGIYLQKGNFLIPLILHFTLVTLKKASWTLDILTIGRAGRGVAILALQPWSRVCNMGRLGHFQYTMVSVAISLY